MPKIKSFFVVESQFCSGAQDAAIIHQHIPQLLEYGIRDGKEAIVLTDVGENLFELIEDKKLNWHLAYPRVMGQLVTQILRKIHVSVFLNENFIWPSDKGLTIHAHQWHLSQRFEAEQCWRRDIQN